ncbi:hypothetical protein [Microbacterium sp.]|uniref:hypothetical protein n=1 Tax=Microbacterium sp. TaxID=51671 RepID=UPI003F6F58A2
MLLVVDLALAVTITFLLVANAPEEKPVTVITANGMQTAFGPAAAPLRNGWVIVEARAGGEPFIRVDGADIEFPRQLRIAIVDGALERTLDFVPPPSDRAYTWIRIEDVDGLRSLERNVLVPATGTFDYGDLVDVDPFTFVPSSDPSVLDTVQTVLLDGLRLERLASKAEYDALPRPLDPSILYLYPTP